MTIDKEVTDGHWHHIRIMVLLNNVLALYIDGQKAGYEIDIGTGKKNALITDVDYYILGKPGEQGFRGCMANFTVNNELQTLYESNSLLIPEVPKNMITDQCDIKVLESTETKTAIDVGVIVVLIFFVLLFSVFCVSFLFYKLRKQNLKQTITSSSPALANLGSSENVRGINNLGLEHSPRVDPGTTPTASTRSVVVSDDAALTNSAMMLNNQKQTQYDRAVYQQQHQLPLHRPSSPRTSFDDELHNSHHHHHHHLYRGDPGSAEHYDLENASSIAPSDIDVVYHYKGFRDGGGGGGFRGRKSLSKRKTNNNKNPSQHHNTPLARLSPSSEMSHNTPRILTLKDLSGKPLPPSLFAAPTTEQSERSLASPLSHMSHQSSSTTRDGGRRDCGQLQINTNHANKLEDRGGGSGLTTDNVAKLNMERSQGGSAGLIATLDDVMSSSNAGGKHRTVIITPHTHHSSAAAAGDASSSSSSSVTSENDDISDDSFTCSEFECDDIEATTTGRSEQELARNNQTINKSSAASRAGDVNVMSRGGMIFNKLIDNDIISEDEDDSLLEKHEGGVGENLIQSNDKGTWEQILNWFPEYLQLAGVFKDIAELPHNNCNSVTRGESGGAVGRDANIGGEGEEVNPTYENFDRPPPIGLDVQDTSNEQFI